MQIPCFVDKSFLLTCKTAIKVCKLDKYANLVVQETVGEKLVHKCGVVDFKPFKCSDKRKKCLLCKASEHPKYPKPKCEQVGVIYVIICNICQRNNDQHEYIGESKRPIHKRFDDHHKKLTVAEMNKHKNPKKNSRGQYIIDDHMPSAVSAHCMLSHDGVYDLSIGQLSVKRQEDTRKAYEALACRKFEPKLNRRSEGGQVIPT